MENLIDKINKLWKRVQVIDNILAMQAFKVITEDNLNKGVVFSASDTGDNLVTYNAILDSLKSTKQALEAEIKATAAQLGAL